MAIQKPCPQFDIVKLGQSRLIVPDLNYYIALDFTLRGRHGEDCDKGGGTQKDYQALQ